MASPGGRSVDEALRAADSALESHREGAMRSLGAILADLEATCVERRQADVYPQAAALLDLSGFFATGPLHPAVFSLCEISDGRSETGGWDWPSIDVHVRAIRRILNDGCGDTEEARVVLEGLSAVRRRLQDKSIVN